MDTLTRCGEELEQEATRPVLVARSQSPEVLPAVHLGAPATPPTHVAAPPPTPPDDASAPAVGIRVPDVTPPSNVTPAVANEPTPPAPTTADHAAPHHEGDAQVRIVASIGNNPIYESEVREAVYQRLGEFMRLTEAQCAIKEREIFRQELRKIIERELVLDDMKATLTAHKQSAMLAKFGEAARKEADARLREFKKERGIPSDAEFRRVLRSQGLTLSGIRRQIERGYMMSSYLHEKLSPNMDKLSLADMREYYAAHINEFKAEDSVKWQDLFVSADRFKSRGEARKYADAVAARAARGDDFVKLVTEFGMGDSRLRKGAGIGEKAGEIFPQELEPTILARKAGQITIKETETGYHILRVAERTYAGPRPTTKNCKQRFAASCRARSSSTKPSDSSIHSGSARSRKSGSSERDTRHWLLYSYNLKMIDSAPGGRLPVKLHRHVCLITTEDAILAEELLAQKAGPGYCRPAN